MKTIHVLILGILIGLSAAALILIITGEPRGEPIALAPIATPSKIVIYISGAVIHPGVYRLDPASRAEDAVRAAGGLSADADPIHANLARRLLDGDQVIIPGQASLASDGSPVAGMPIDINSATAEQLDAIPGIGLVKAQSIVAYRETHGPFGSLEELLNVPGIGLALLEQMRPYLLPIQAP